MGIQDRMKALRAKLHSWLLEARVPCRLHALLQGQELSELFSSEEVSHARSLFSAWLQENGHTGHVCWDIPMGQPYALHALHALSACLQYKDSALFPALLAGVPTGFDSDIPPSGCLLPAPPNENAFSLDLAICQGNWQGAEADPASLQELIQAKEDAGFVREFPSLEAAQSYFGADRVAVGRVNIVHSHGKKPRLVVDSSVCHTNQACRVPEKSSLPSLADVLSAFPLRQDIEEASAFSADIRAAHKTVRIREKDQGLLGFRQQERLLFYKVAPFGAVFSSHWFARVGGFFVRVLHQLIFLAHVLMLYSDDLLLWQNRKVLPLGASVVLCFFACFGIPISWPKLQMGRKVTWIGWELNFSAGGFRLPKDKRDKAIALLEACFSGRHVPKKHLDKVLGLMQWILQCAPELRPWLCCLYDDMHRPLGTAYSVDPSEWPCIAAHLSDSLQFISTPRGTSIPVGSSLLSARHTNLKTKADLRLVPISSRRVWLRVADPSSSRRKLSEPSREMLRFLLWWCKHPWPWRPLALPPVLPFESAADAFGEGDACGVGGWLRLGSAQCFWFSERFCPADFRKLGIPVKDDANRDISAYETLAQGFLLVLLLRTISGGRLRVRLPALSDNVGAESVINRLYTSKQPLALFVQCLAMWACAHSVSLACSHIAGEKNDVRLML